MARSALLTGEHQSLSMLAYVWRRSRDAGTGAAWHDPCHVRTAAPLGLVVPPPLLALADSVIE
jgi:hypothetical protein